LDQRSKAFNQPAQRQFGYDIARAMAVFGMVVVNFTVVMSGDGQGAGWLVRLVGLLEGRAAATFVVLAGVGMSLLTRRARQASDGRALAVKRKALLKRAVFLFCFGLAYAPLWPADILHFYGIYIIIGAFLLNASDRTLCYTYPPHAVLYAFGGGHGPDDNRRLYCVCGKIQTSPLAVQTLDCHRTAGVDLLRGPYDLSTTLRKKSLSLGNCNFCC
jgi:hypothetical protein